MRQLRLVGLADDGGSLVLESPTGESYRLPVDERVRAACRGDLTRLGQIEIETDNPLRPREIQARVRAGESAEQVAASSGMALDRVLRFANPVLQERSRVVAQARSTPVRARTHESLGDLVEERLVSRGTDAATLAWDAWRREDGRWAVRLGWRHGDRAHAAHWSLDLGRRALQPDDPAAEQLSAEEFHARTITAVTPLAVAARAAGEAAARHPAAPAGRAGPAGAARIGGAGPAGGADPARGARGGTAGSAVSAGPAGSAGSAGGDTAPGREVAAGPAVSRADRTDAGKGAGARRSPPDRGASRSAPQRADRADRAGTDAVRAAGRAETRPREPQPEEADPEEDGDPAAEGRIAAGGGTIPLVDVPTGEDERGRRATVPSWDDILLGVRRRH